jgi:hypothetical protein
LDQCYCSMAVDIQMMSIYIEASGLNIEIYFVMLLILLRPFTSDRRESVCTDLMLENGPRINSMLRNGGYFYVCGDTAYMARDVSVVLTKILEKERKLKVNGGDELVKLMRTSGLYLEDIL